MAEKEKSLLNKILKTLNRDQRYFRINAGMGWTGDTQYWQKGDLFIRNARPLHAAPEGWPDLSGWETITITSDMVGQKIAVFSAIEVKSQTGRLTKKQKSFKDLLEKMGGRFRVERYDA